MPITTQTHHQVALPIGEEDGGKVDHISPLLLARYLVSREGRHNVHCTPKKAGAHRQALGAEDLQKWSKKTEQVSAYS